MTILILHSKLMGDDLTIEALEQANHKSANDPKCMEPKGLPLRDRAMEQSDQIPNLGAFERKM